MNSHKIHYAFCDFWRAYARLKTRQSTSSVAYGVLSLCNVHTRYTAEGPCVLMLCTVQKQVTVQTTKSSTLGKLLHCCVERERERDKAYEGKEKRAVNHTLDVGVDCACI